MNHILVAEDESFIADLYKINLEKAGMKVTVTHDGAEAIASIQKTKPDLLLLDLLMPGIDGFAVLQWIHDHASEGVDMPVIVLTNLSEEINKKKCTELGAAECVIKSDVRAKDIVALVQKYLAKS